MLAEAKAASPLIRLAMFHDSLLNSSLAMSSIVATVVTTTLVIGPFYLTAALGLDAAMVGFVLSVGPLVAARAAAPRNLGRITGASVMGAVFALASATSNIETVHPEAVATGMRITFRAAAILIAVALMIAMRSHYVQEHRSINPRMRIDKTIAAG